MSHMNVFPVPVVNCTILLFADDNDVVLNQMVPTNLIQHVCIVSLFNNA